MDVFVRCRNSAPWIARTLTSILDQAEIGARVLVADDASSDDTCEQVRALGDRRITLTRLPVTRGEAHCLNLLLRQARSDVVVTVPDDADLLPRALKRILDHLTGSPRAGLVYASGFLAAERGDVRREAMRRAARLQADRIARHGALGYLVAFGDHHLGPTAYRRAALEDIGGFEETSGVGASIGAAFRLPPRQYAVGALPQLLCVRRRGDAGGPASRARHALALVRRASLYGRARGGLGSGSAGVLHRCAAVLATRGLERIRALGGAGWLAARTVVLWKLLLPLRDRLYDRAISRFAAWPIGLTRDRAGRPEGRASIAYYLWRYPELSETFIRRELTALSRAGLDVRLIAEENAPAGPALAPSTPVAQYLGPMALTAALRDLGRCLVRRPLRTLNLAAYVCSGPTRDRSRSDGTPTCS